MAVLGPAAHRVPYRQLLTRGAGQVLQHLDRHHAALAVADQQGHHAVALVVPGDGAGKLAAVDEAAVGQAAVARIAQAFGRITHGDQELGKGRHRVDRHAAVQRDDARRRHPRQHLAHVLLGDAQRVEGEQALLELRVEFIALEGRREPDRHLSEGRPGRRDGHHEHAREQRAQTRSAHRHGDPLCSVRPARRRGTKRPVRAR